MSDEATQSTPDLPSAEELCISHPLYTTFEVPNTATHQNQLFSFITSKFQLDTFCPWCGQPTVLLGGKNDL